MSAELSMAAIGGTFIGLAAVLLLSLTGRIAGISGIFWGALSAQAPYLWRWLFLAGLMAGAAIAHRLFAVPLPEPSALSPTTAIAGGLLVGVGVKLGSGCTSGHGVCGMGLTSRRSILATLVFMVAGIATVFVVRHVLGVSL